MKTDKRLLVTLFMAIAMGMQVMAQDYAIDYNLYVAGKKLVICSDGENGHYASFNDYCNDLSLGGGTAEISGSYGSDSELVLKLTDVTINDPKAIYVDEHFISGTLKVEFYGTNYIYSSGQPVT